MLTPRWFRWLDAMLAALWGTGVVYLAMRVLGPLFGGDQVALTMADAAVLLGAVVATALLRKLILWPRAVRAMTLEGASDAVGWWPGAVRRIGLDDVCAASWEALVALRLTSSWWSRYRALAVRHDLRGGVGRALAMVAVVVGLTIPVFLLQQAIAYGSPRGQWLSEGFAAWARALVKSGLAVGVSAAVWWGVLTIVLQLVWAVLALRERPADRAARWVWWGAWLTWAAVPLALVVRQGV